MIVLFTDFGRRAPYLGQMRAVLAREAPGVAVIDLVAEAPAFDARGSAYLLAALVPTVAPDAVWACVVDPGVGTDRRALALEAAGRWLVGPDNGLLEIVARRHRPVRWHRLDWRPARLSATFHGRDLFAPVAARLASGRGLPASAPAEAPGVSAGWPDDLPEVVLVDDYGNATTGLRARALGPGTRLEAGGVEFARVGTYGEARPGAAVWYENSFGLAELACVQGSAALRFGLRAGAKVRIREA